MSLPMLDGQVRSSTALLDAYTTFYTQHEAFYEPLQPDNALNQIGVHIGAGCLQLAKGDMQSATDMLEAAKQPLQIQVEQLASSTNGRQTTARLMLHTLNMLTMLDRSEELAAERQALHGTVASELDSCLQAAELFYSLPRPSDEEIKRHGDRRGLISDLTSLGLVTREPKDELLGVTALAHHDWSADSSRSHDNLLLRLDDDGVPSFYPMQVKAGCINACREVKGGRWYKTLERYDPSIVLVSGHCDFGFGQESRLAADDDHFPLAALLTKEVFGQPTPAEADKLTMASEQFVDTITSGERNGLAGIDRVSQSQ